MVRPHREFLPPPLDPLLRCDVFRIREVPQRHRERPLHLRGIEDQIIRFRHFRRPHQADDRRDAERVLALERSHPREDLDARGVDSHLLVGLAQGRAHVVAEVGLVVHLAPREADLPPVGFHRARSAREEDVDAVVAVVVVVVDAGGRRRRRRRPGAAAAVVAQTFATTPPALEQRHEDAGAAQRRVAGRFLPLRAQGAEPTDGDGFGDAGVVGLLRRRRRRRRHRGLRMRTIRMRMRRLA